MYIANIPPLAKMYSSGITTTYVFWVDIHVHVHVLYMKIKIANISAQAISLKT